MEILVAHRVVRTLMGFMRTWMETILDPYQNPSHLTDEDIVGKIIQYYLSAEEEMLGRKPPAAKSNSEQWRRMTGYALDEPTLPSSGTGANPTASSPAAVGADATVVAKIRSKDEHAASRRLCKSIVGLACKHFLFIRQFVKRYKVMNVSKSKQK
jgi:hypothetical protein